MRDVIRRRPAHQGWTKSEIVIHKLALSPEARSLIIDSTKSRGRNPQRGSVTCRLQLEARLLSRDVVEIASHCCPMGMRRPISRARELP